MNAQLNSRERGIAVPLALVAIVLLFTMGTSLLSLGMNARIYSIRSTSEIAARSAADAGLTKALFEMNEKLKVQPWNGSNLPQTINESLPSSNAFFNYTVTGDLGSGYTIQSTGICGQNTKTVACTLKLQGPFEAAIFTEDDLILYNSAEVDGYNYGENEGTLKIGTNSTDSESIILKSSVTVNGDVYVGVEGNPNDIIDNKGTITGEMNSLTQEYDIPQVSVPQWLASLPSSGNIKNDTTISNSARYDSIDLNSGKTITITGDVVLYVAGDMILKNTAELLIEEGASLTLYLGGNFEGKNSSDMNNETQIPDNLNIYSLDSCESMIFKNSSDFYGTIYAPDADIEMDNSADFYGAVVANSFDQKNSAAFYYDASLRDVSVSDEAVRFAVTQWNEQ